MATNIGFPESPKGHRNPWGLWATAGLSLLTYLLYLAAGIGVVIAVTASYLIDNPEMDRQKLAQVITSDGAIVFDQLLISASLGILILLFLIKIKKGPSIREYLCLHPLSWKIFVIWILLVFLFVSSSDALSYLLDRPIVPEYWAKLLQTAPPILMVIITVLLVAPVFEEVLFRGFMFAGIEGSRLGARGAIVITALTWSVIHFQYDLYWIATIFALGIVLGMARLRTNSLYLTIAMHATVNAIAMVEASALA